MLLGLERESESLMDYFDSFGCLLLTLEVYILHFTHGDWSAQFGQSAQNTLL
jgi:hypothetical protein